MINSNEKNSTMYVQYVGQLFYIIFTYLYLLSVFVEGNVDLIYVLYFKIYVIVVV